MIAVTTLSALVVMLQQPATQTPSDWKTVDRILGRSGSMQGETYRVGFPRSDLHVTVGAVTVQPALALGSWAAFKQTGDSNAMLTGDLVLLESEVGPVMDALEAGGVEPTAVHNHLKGESPHILYMHIGGRGSLTQLATAVHNALGRTKTPATGTPAKAPVQTVDTAQIAQIIGAHGKVNGGVYQLSFPRATPVMMDSMEVPPAMGVATAINFQRTGRTTAATTGDFVLIASEVAPVAKALRANGIEVTALHSHMLDETPRLFFMHFWGTGDATKLARGLRAALDAVNIKRD
jgi:Domain of Unknown Function (DUF1259)